MKIYSVKQIREIEADYFAKHENAEFTLMERAGLAAFKILSQNFKGQQSYSVFIGKGNNGGDGLVLANLLIQEGHKVQIICLDEASRKGNKILEQAYSLLADYEFKKFSDKLIFSEQEIIIDAIFGIGLNSKLSDEYRQVIGFINSLNKYVVSLDIASGIYADSGNIADIAIKADLTISFIGYKIGLFIGEGKAYSGELKLADLDIDLSEYEGCINLVAKHDLKRLLPVRKVRSNKGSFGKLLIIAGDENMPGALLLSAQAALRSGIGKLFVYTAKANHEFIVKILPEAILLKEDGLDEILSEVDACLLGPGLGYNPWGRDLSRKILQSKIAKVIDADALNFLAKEPQKLENSIITPHLLEAARLLDLELAELRQDIIKTLNCLADKYQANVLLKTEVNYLAILGEKNYLVPYGNDALAKAGTGDVLAGLTAGFLVQTGDIKRSMLLSSLTHSLFALYWQKNYATRSMLASDIILHLPRFFKDLETDNLEIC